MWEVVEPRYLLREQDWRGLLYLSHADKARAFEEYAGFYMRTNGQTYDSDTFQLSMYIDDYHRELDRSLGAEAKCTETITEVYTCRCGCWRTSWMRRRGSCGRARRM